MPSKLTTEEFIKKAKEIHGDKYDYSLVKYINNKTKVKIICPEHGEFNQTPDSHLSGRKCSKCSKIESANIRRFNDEDFIEKASYLHNNFYDYSKVIYKKSLENVTIICPEHGEFNQKACSHLRGHGCPQCFRKRLKEKHSHSNFHFINKAIGVYGEGVYDYSLVSYSNCSTKINIICEKHGIFEQNPNNHLKGIGCPKCSISGPSRTETEVYDFVLSLGVDAISSDRTLIGPYELDIVIPDYKLAIEFNGLYWHSEKFLNKNYHKMKTDMVEAKGYQLIHIFEDEWANKRNIVESKIKSLLGVSETKIHARKCTIKIPTKEEKKDFFNNYHIQGSIGSNIDLGLYYDNNMVCCLTFLDKKNGVFDLNRFASSFQAVGGFSKLLSYFKNQYEWKSIITFADRRYSQGDLYYKNGFEFQYNTNPNYFYVHGQVRKSRNMFQKHKLKDNLVSFNESKSEHQNMLDNGYYRIYDCGHMKFKLTN